MTKRLAIVSTHPIQYNVPFFIKLAELQELNLKVFYTYNPQLQGHFDREFGKPIQWDVPLDEGYDFKFIENTSSKPGTSHRRGVINPGLIQAVESFLPDFILVYGWNYESHWRCIKYFSGKVPILFRGDSTDIDSISLWKNALRNIYLKWVYRYIDYALYCGSANKDYFKHHGLNDSQLVSVPHAVDNNRFENEPADFRDQWNIPRSAIVILFAGKYIQKKSPDSLLEVFLKLENLLDSDTYIVFVGDGALRPKLLEMSQRSDKVRILGFFNQSQMPAVYNTCDIFCLPSTGPGETWGLAVNEAMAAGKSILVSDRVGCAHDLIRNGENGYIFSPSVKGDLLTKLKLMVADKKKLLEMGSVSKEKINNWNYQIGIDNLSQLLSSLIK